MLFFFFFQIYFISFVIVLTAGVVNKQGSQITYTVSAMIITAIVTWKEHWRRKEKGAARGERKKGKKGVRWIKKEPPTWNSR